MAIAILPYQRSSKDPTSPRSPRTPPDLDVSLSRCCNRNMKRSFFHPEPTVVVKPPAKNRTRLQKPIRARLPPRPRKPSPQLNGEGEPMVVRPPAQRHLLMGKVTILKSGETVPECLMKKEEASGPVLGSSDEPKLERETTSLEKKSEVCGSNKEVDYFAGFGFYASPPPTSLPIPRFLAKKGTTEVTAQGSTVV